MPLSEALQVAQAIADNNAGRPMNRILLAQAMDVSPSSSSLRDRIMASYRYGLTDGNYKSEQISLTVIGDAATRPRHQEEAVTARREAFRRVPIFAQLLDHFANARLPETRFLTNTLERPPFSIDPSWSHEIADLFIRNSRDVGYIRVMRGSNYLVVDAGTAPPPDDEGEAEPEGIEDQEAERAPADAIVSPPTIQEPTARPVPVQVFIAHGANRKPLDQLKKILNEWQVPFVVAVDEPHVGRPISEKVADLMRTCSAGIFIFTADETLTSSAGETVSRPSQNVVYELGAAGLLYGRKIVIFKERGVTFPSDFSDLGWIEFERDALDAKAMDLLRELIGLKAVRLVSSTSQ
jgi:predicted nucleotide-binding protein